MSIAPRDTAARIAAALRAAALGAAAAACAAGSAHAATEAEIAAARNELVARMVSEHKFDRAELVQLLEGATIVQSVLDAISRPAERVVPWHEYRNIFLNEARIAAGVKFWEERGEAVQRASAKYEVAPEMIVAIIGVETLYGQRMGNYSVLDSLATLAFAYPPRARFFAGELEQFLLLVREEDVDVSKALGSYAGAMGAGQFIPSSYRAYAVDGSGDGKRNLWSDWDDVLASVANYFAVHDWRSGAPVAVRATRSASFDGAEPTNGLDLDATVGSLRAQGYVFPTNLPADTPAAVYALEAAGGGMEYWVGFHNFRVITRYNRSPKYALAAYQLSETIRGRYAADNGSGAQ
jgi:membrane-bound lytic murein transglycosylase B